MHVGLEHSNTFFGVCVKVSFYIVGRIFFVKYDKFDAYFLVLSIGMKLTIRNEDEIGRLVDAFFEISQGEKIVFLYGDLGAGKTTFVKSLVRRLGSEDETSSPTYSLVNAYDVVDGKLYHIDLYRLDSEQEALEIGIEDYLYSGDYCMIEWPQVIEKLVDRAVEIKIIANEDESRFVELDLVNY